MRNRDEMKEITIERDHIKRAADSGAVCIKGKVEGRAAFPDQLILKPKGFYWVEFKVPGNPLQDDQVEMHKVLRKKGHKVYVCSSKVTSTVILVSEFG